MSVALHLWSRAITPGEAQALVLPTDVRLTNASLGDVLADESGRSVLKILYQAPSAMDEDDEDDEDAEDKEGAPASTFICALTPGKTEQTVLDITLLEETEYIFEITGKNTIYLTGNHIQQNDNEPPYGDEFDDESDDEDAYHLGDVSSDVEMHPDDLADVETDASRFEEVVESTSKASKKRAREVDAETEEKPVSKADKKKNKKQKTEDAAKVDKADETKQEKPKKKESEATTTTLEGGLSYKETTPGTGAGARKGQKIEMRYIGKLASNGKKFDANTKGKPFKFTLGAGEVIKGWDLGLAGIKVGGERVLTIPAPLGYGKRGSPPEIPPNAALIFEVKCLSIK